MTQEFKYLDKTFNLTTVNRQRSFYYRITKPIEVWGNWPLATTTTVLADGNLSNICRQSYICDLYRQIFWLLHSGLPTSYQTSATAEMAFGHSNY